jgi:hypothetical protein
VLHCIRFGFSTHNVILHTLVGVPLRIPWRGKSTKTPPSICLLVYGLLPHRPQPSLLPRRCLQQPMYQLHLRMLRTRSVPVVDG